MKIAKYGLRALFILMFAQGCNTLYNTKSINIEVLEPGKVKFPEGYSKIAMRYNNTNIAYNPVYSSCLINSDIQKDTTNLDSIASFIYYDYVLNTLREQDFLDTIYDLSASNYSHININDSLPPPADLIGDSLELNNENSSRISAYILSRYLRNNPAARKNTLEIKALDPEFGLYTANEISHIADSTHADLLLSFDHFLSLNTIFELNNRTQIEEVVSVNAFWTAYDLHEKKLLRCFIKSDTIDWVNFSAPGIDPFKLLPPRRDAVLNASDISGTRFAEYLSPHWLQVERFYYRSGHVELKQTDRLVSEGKWLDAAEAWKGQIDNPNKSIAAKCMFNLGVASEMSGDLDSALDWVVRSYHVFGEKNVLHAENCRLYIQVLAKRRVDAGLLDKYYFAE